jgi:hypothetical protein
VQAGVLVGKLDGVPAAHDEREARPFPLKQHRGKGRWPKPSLIWMATVLLVLLLGATALVRWDIAARREAFAVDARIAHRLLSQRAAQLDAVLATLVLVAQEPGAEAHAERLPALWPAVLTVQRSDAQHPWPEPGLVEAEQRSRALPAHKRHAVLAGVDAERLQYSLVLAGMPASWALRVDATRLVPAQEWPFSNAGPVRAALVTGGASLLLHPGAPAEHQPAGLTQGFTFFESAGNAQPAF